MLKKALAVATLAVAATGAAGTIAPAAVASDTTGGDYSQNINVLPHWCLDAKRVLNGIILSADVLTETKGQQCNEKTKYKTADKSALSDFIDAGAAQY